MAKREENESINDFLLRGVEHLMASLPEPGKQKSEWEVLRPSQTAKGAANALIGKIVWDGLIEPKLLATLDSGFSFEWKTSGRGLDIYVEADGLLEYLVVINNGAMEEGEFALEDGKLEFLIAWLKGDPKTHALLELDQLVKLPEGESSWNASRPKSAAMGLARAIVEAIDWRGMPIPNVCASGDGTIHLKWQMPSGREFQMFIESNAIEYLTADTGGVVSKGEFVLGELTAWLKS